MKPAALGIGACICLAGLLSLATAQSTLLNGPPTNITVSPPASPMIYTFGAGTPTADPLEHKINELLGKWKGAKDQTDREGAQEQVRELLNKQFQERLAGHEKEIEQLEAKVKELREQLALRRQKPDEIVDFRLQQLLREAQGLGWGTESGTGRSGGGFAFGGGRYGTIGSASGGGMGSSGGIGGVTIGGGAMGGSTTNAKKSLSKAESTRQETKQITRPKTSATRKVPFVIGPQAFAKGDEIKIAEVWSELGTLEKGDTVTVTGTCTLASHPTATLWFYITEDASKAVPDEADGAVAPRIHAGTVPFKLERPLTAEGDLHLGFYDDQSGDCFGKVYFGTAAQILKARVKTAQPETKVFLLESGDYKLTVLRSTEQRTEGGVTSSSNEGRMYDVEVENKDGNKIVVYGDRSRLIEGELRNNVFSGIMMPESGMSAASPGPGPLPGTLKLQGKLTADNKLSGDLATETKDGQKTTGTFKLVKKSAASN